MGRYKSPRKLNFISGIVLLALLAGVYSVVRFGPVYYRKWQAKSVLSEAASKAVSKRVFNERVGGGQEQIAEIVTWAEDRLRKLGVGDATLAVTISDKGDAIEAQAQYTERIKHPFVKKITTLYFRPSKLVTKASGFD